MSRRRYLSTKISQDARINRLALQHGDFAALFYTWMIPHAEDDGTLSGDPDELLMTVMPGRRDKSVEDIEAALSAMHTMGLIVWERTGEHPTVCFPKSFYTYQSYISAQRRESAQAASIPDSPRPSPSDSPRSSAKQRKTAQNAVSFKSSFPLELKLKRESARRAEHDGDEIPPSTDEGEPLTRTRTASRTKNESDAEQMSPPVPIPKAPASHPLWDVLVEVFYQPTTKNERSNFGKIVKQLNEVGATPDDVRFRVKQHTKLQNHWDLTPNALINHWSELAGRTGHSNGTPQSGAPYDPAQDEAFMERRREAAELVRRIYDRETS